MRSILFVVTLLLLMPRLAAQTGSDRERVVAAEAAIKSATAELRKLAASREAPEPYRQRRDRLRGAIHRTVDAFVEATTDNRSAAVIADDLLTVLADHVLEHSYGDPPAARTVVTRAGTGLLVTYNIHGRRHDSSPTIRAYSSSETGRYRLVATTGDDFADGFKVRSRVIRSPLPSEGWLMVWGQLESANGFRIRFRIYAFDGEAFRTIWAPEGLFDNAELAIRDSGFEIKHLLKDRLLWEFVRDDYLLTADGPIRISQVPIN